MNKQIGATIMDFIVTVLVIAGIVLMLKGHFWLGVFAFIAIMIIAKGIPGKQKNEPAQSQLKPDNGWQEFNAFMTAAEREHPAIFHPIMMLAGSDGTISKQELRVIIGLFSRLGMDTGNRMEELITAHGPRYTYQKPYKPSIEDLIKTIPSMPENTRRELTATAQAIVACTMKPTQTKLKQLANIQNQCQST